MALPCSHGNPFTLSPVARQLPVQPVARPINAETGEDVFLNPAWEPPFREYQPNRSKRTRNLRNTKPASGVERFDPFHSMRYNAEEAEAVPSK